MTESKGTKNIFTTKNAIILLTIMTICSVLAYLSVRLQSIEDAIYTATYFSFIWVGMLLFVAIVIKERREEKRLAGLRDWYDEDFEELEERIRRLEERRY